MPTHSWLPIPASCNEGSAHALAPTLSSGASLRQHDWHRAAGRQNEGPPRTTSTARWLCCLLPLTVTRVNTVRHASLQMDMRCHLYGATPSTAKEGEGSS